VEPSAPEEVWPRAKAAAGPRLRVMLETLSVRSATPKLLTLAVPPARAAMVRDHLPEIVRLVQEVGGHAMSISIVEQATETAPAQKVNDADAAPAVVPVAELSEHPLVKEAERVFNAKIVHVQPKR
jgi:hypothetical protein